jgi:hypothetical protein
MRPAKPNENDGSGHRDEVFKDAQARASQLLENALASSSLADSREV